MKHYLSIFALVLTAAFSTQAQIGPDTAELTRLLNEFLVGAGKNDVAVHDRFWADDLIYTRSAGARINKAELMKGVRSAPPSKPTDPVSTYTAEDIQIQQYGNAAVVAFRLVSITMLPDGTTTTRNNLNTGTFIKRKRKWQVVAWQSTIIPKPEATKAVTLSTAATTPSNSNRTYIRGSRGGCHYLSSGGSKIYVDRALCK